MNQITAFIKVRLCFCTFICVTLVNNDCSSIIFCAYFLFIIDTKFDAQVLLNFRMHYVKQISHDKLYLVGTIACLMPEYTCTIIKDKSTSKIIADGNYRQNTVNRDNSG